MVLFTTVPRRRTRGGMGRAFRYASRACGSFSVEIAVAVASMLVATERDRFFAEQLPPLAGLLWLVVNVTPKIVYNTIVHTGPYNASNARRPSRTSSVGGTGA